MTMLTLAIWLCFSGTIAAAPMTTRLSGGSASYQVIGQQTHRTSTATSRAGGLATGSASPNFVITCDIYDYTSKSGQTLYVQVAVSCPVDATITISAYADTCSAWNASEGFCMEWNRSGGGITCPAIVTTYTMCPRTYALPVQFPRGAIVQAEYWVTTTIPGSNPPTDTGTYYSGPYFF